MSAWVRSSITQKVYIGLDWNTNVGGYISTTASAAISLTANTWTQVFVTGTAPATATQGNLSVLATAGGANWSIGATFDIQGVLIETGTTQGVAFAGSTASTTGLPTNKTYAWTGTADASTSTETTRTVTLTVTGATLSNGRPYAQAVITDAGTASAYTVRLTRLCEGVTMNVQGAMTRVFTDSDVINDYATALNRSETYSLLWNGTVVASAIATVTATTAWLSDPVQPDKGIPVKLDGSNPGYLTMSSDSLKETTYAGGAKTIPILGSSYPALIGGQPTAQSGMAMALFSDDKTTADAFRSMIVGTPILLLQPLVGMDPLPAVAFMSREVKERDVNRVFGGTIASWLLTGSLVAAVNQAVLSGNVLYSDVQALISTANTYGQVQTRAAATTYLDWQKNPKIWSLL
jgi:hypothetical protein